MTTSDMPSKPLAFTDLDRRHAGVSPGLAATFAEAVRVCLDRHHRSPSTFRVTGNQSEHRATLEWQGAGDRLNAAWANTDDATEYGAYGLSLAAIESTRGLVAVRRAETRTGADYYLGLPGADPEDLEFAFRLEVSGTDLGNEAAIQARVREKLEQARLGHSNLPAIAAVAGFAAARIVIADLPAP